MTFTVLLDQLDGVAEQNPVLIVFEDAHWIDPTSLDLLDRTVARVADLPVLEVISAVHFAADLTLGLGKVVHDYLQPTVTRATERRLACVS